MTSIPDAFNLALQSLNAGQAQSAEQIVRQILQVQADHFDSLHLMGFLMAQSGRFAESIDWFQRAIRVNPLYGDLYGNLGFAQHSLGQFDDAVRSYERALQLNPNDTNSLCNLSNTLKAQGKVDAAIERLQRAIRLNPNDATLHNNLGTALKAQGNLDQAIACYQQALRIDPNDTSAHCNMGTALMSQARLDAAVDSFHRALKLNPRLHVAHSNLGATLQKQEKLDEAAASYRRALDLVPNYAESHNNLGTLLQKQMKCEQAIASYRQAINLVPDYAEARYNLGTALLQTGDFTSGWQEYEFRVKTIPLLELNRPKWDGSSLAGRRILLLAEQGLGDTLQFIRYAPLLKAQGGHVIVASQPALMELLKWCPGIDEIIEQPKSADSPLPHFDVYLHLISLSGAFGTTLDSIPNQVPYLQPATDLVAQWRHRLGHGDDLKVGIAWQGNRANPRDAIRSHRLAELEQIGKIPGIKLFSLQKGDGREQIQQLAGRMSVTDFTDQMSATNGPFLDLTAMMSSLDLVISADTSIAHLAAALGRPVWLALNHSSDWRWLRDREDSPWYPTMKIFRQPSAGDWRNVFGRMEDALRGKVEGRMLKAETETTSTE